MRNLLREIARHFHREDVWCDEPRIGGRELLHRAREQPGTREQHQRHRDLGDHQRLLQALLSLAAATAHATRAQPLPKRIFLAHTRHERENRRHQSGEQEGEEQHHSVHRNLVRPRRESRCETREHSHAGVRHHHAEQRAAEGEHAVLDEQHPAQTHGAGAKGRAHGHLVFTAHAAHQREVHHVRAGDDQHEGRGAHQQPERAARILPEHFLERRDGDLEVRARRIRLGIRLMHARGDRGDLGARLVHGRRGIEARDHLGHPVRAPVLHQRAHVMLADGHIHQGLDAAGEEGHRLQHADDVHLAARDAQLATDNRRVATEAREPVAVREHNDWRRAGAVVAGVERPAKDGAEPHHGEVVASDESDVDLRGVVAVHHIERELRILGDVGERLGLLAEVVDLGDGERDVGGAEPFGGLAQVHQAIAVGVRERAEQHAAEHGEDGGVGADAEPEGEDDGEGEAARVPEAAEDVAEGQGHLGGRSEGGSRAKLPR